MAHKEYRIYKPKKDGKGAASKIQCTVKMRKQKYAEATLFWEIAQQNGVDSNQNAIFEWSDPKNKEKTGNITVKLGLPDIGEILMVLSGKKKEAKLFHQKANGNTSFNFSVFNDGYSLQIGTKVGEKLTRLQHTITGGEGMILGILLRDFVTKHHDW